MTFHAERLGRSNGATAGKARRIMCSLPPEDMELLTWWAAKKKLPVASVLRDAVAAYFMPFKNSPASRETVTAVEAGPEKTP